MLRPARRALLPVVLLLGGGCTTRLYEGPPLPAEQVATIHVGSTVVRGIDGRSRRGGAFDASEFEVVPGPHRLTLVFERPALNLGLKTLPAQPGTGVCVLEFIAVARRHYFLGSRVSGETHDPRWDGAWEGWVRDPAVSSDDDVIARCESHEAVPEPPTPAVAVAPPATPAVPAPAPAAPVVPAVAPPPPAPVTALETPVRLGSLRLDGTPDAAGVAAALAANFDVVALTATRADYDALRSALGAGWDGLLTHDTRAAQISYAVLYRRDRIRPCAGWESLQVVAAGADAAPAAAGCFAADVVEVPGLERLPIRVRVR